MIGNLIYSGSTLVGAVLLAVSALGAPLEFELVSFDRLPPSSETAKSDRRPGMLSDGDGVADLAVPDNSRTSLRVVTFAGGSFRELTRIDFSAEIASSLRPADIGADRRMGLAFRLSDGRVVGLVFGR